MTRFEFGDNWHSYAANYTEDRRAFARAQLERLVGSEIRGATFLDIGCGSGLHSLAALDLGAEAVTAIDIDPVSVATAEPCWADTPLASRGRSANLTFSQASVTLMPLTSCTPGESFITLAISGGHSNRRRISYVPVDFS